jgi:hypothetical protein
VFTGNTQLSKVLDKHAGMTGYVEAGMTKSVVILNLFQDLLPAAVLYKSTPQPPDKDSG